jgi:hypothetical protein
MLDEKGSAHMLQGALTSFTLDRFNCPNSSLALNGGWTQVPSGVYFDSPEFTISVWVFSQQVGFNSWIIDFGNGKKRSFEGNIVKGETPIDAFIQASKAGNVSYKFDEKSSLI